MRASLERAGADGRTMREVPARDRRGARDWWGDPSRRPTPRLGAVRRPARRGPGRRCLRRGAPGARRRDGRDLLAGRGSGDHRARAEPAATVAAAERRSCSWRSSPATRSAAAGSGSASPTRCVETVATYGGRPGAHPGSATRRPDLHDQEDFVRLLGAAALSGGLVVLGGAFVVDGSVTLDPVVPSLATAFTAHVAAVLLLVPLAIVTENHWAGGRLELFLQILLLSGASVLTFVPGASSTLTFAPVLFLAWAALRFDLRVACAELALFGIFVTAQTLTAAAPSATASTTTGSAR